MTFLSYRSLAWIVLAVAVVLAVALVITTGIHIAVPVHAVQYFSFNPAIQVGHP